MLRRHTVAIVAGIAAAVSLTAGLASGVAAQDDDEQVTLTDRAAAGPRQPERHGRVPGLVIRALHAAVRDVDRQGGRGLRHHRGARRVVGGVQRRAHLHLHVARGAAVVRRRTAHRRGHRLHDQPIARRGMAQPLRHHGQPRGDGDRRAHRGDHVFSAGPQAADDGRLHRPQAHLRGALRGRGHDVRRPRRCRLRAVHPRGLEPGPVVDDGRQPQLLRVGRRRAGDRPGGVPGLRQRRRDGRRPPARARSMPLTWSRRSPSRVSTPIPTSSPSRVFRAGSPSSG